MQCQGRVWRGAGVFTSSAQQRLTPLVAVTHSFPAPFGFFRSWEAGQGCPQQWVSADTPGQQPAQHLGSTSTCSATSLWPSACHSLGELISNSSQESWEGGWPGVLLESGDLYWAHAEVSNTFQCPSLCLECQVTASTEDNKPKMWNVGVTGKKSRWR